MHGLYRIILLIFGSFILFLLVVYILTGDKRIHVVNKIENYYGQVGNGYYIEDNKVMYKCVRRLPTYCVAGLVEKADPVSIKSIKNLLNGKDFDTSIGGYALDKNYVFYEEEVLPEANPQTFKLLFNKDYAVYGVDGDNVYYGNNLMVGADAGTFKVIEGDGDKAEDKNKFYNGFISEDK